MQRLQVLHCLVTCNDKLQPIGLSLSFWHRLAFNSSVYLNAQSSSTLKVRNKQINSIKYPHFCNKTLYLFFVLMSIFRAVDNAGKKPYFTSGSKARG